MSYIKSSLLNIIILYSILIPYSLSYQEDEGVLVLTDSNLKSAIKEFDYILVEFYAPWCGHCKSLAPEYSAAAKELKAQDSEIRLAKIDGTENRSSTGTYQVNGYPTLYYFVKGVPIKYGGSRKKDGIIEWVKKRRSPASKELLNIRSVEEFISINISNKELTVVLFGNKGIDSYLTNAGLTENVKFGHCQTKECLKFYKQNNGDVVLYRSFNIDNSNKAVLKGGYSEEDFKKFINREGTPLVITLDDSYRELITKDNVVGLYFTYESDIDQVLKSEIEKLAERISYEVKDYLQVVLFNPSRNQFTKELYDYLGYKQDKIPDIKIVSLKGKPEVYFYKYSSFNDINYEDLKVFCEKWKKGELIKEVKSEPLPLEQSALVKLVGLNFKEIVYDTTKDVFVKLYSPRCGHCVKVAPIWKELAEKISSGQNKNIVIAEIDVSANEFGVDVNSYPTFYLWKADKDNTKVSYEGDRTIEAFSSFIKENAVNKLNLKDDL